MDGAAPFDLRDTVLINVPDCGAGQVGVACLNGLTSGTAVSAYLDQEFGIERPVIRPPLRPTRTCGVPVQMSELEQYTVAHESGHQFLLQHEDGRWPPGDDEEPSGDYIMTDVLGQSGMAPNKTFSAKSLKKIRETDYPPVEN